MYNNSNYYSLIDILECSRTKEIFTEQEDMLLIELVEKQESANPDRYIDWQKIALKMPNKTAKQCRNRFRSYLDPAKKVKMSEKK